MNIHTILNKVILPFRKRRMKSFLQIMSMSPDDRILDVGGTPFNWALINCKNPITLLNLPDSGVISSELSSNLTFAIGDGTQLKYEDKSFDIGFSNSVIEHVGDIEAQRRFASEISRCSHRVWVQTPARSFFFEPHFLVPFLHFLPLSYQKKLIRNFSGWGLLTRPNQNEAEAFVDQTRLLTKQEMLSFFPDCTILEEKFLFMTRSYIAIRLN